MFQKKRLASLLITAAMLLSMLPGLSATALAAAANWQLDVQAIDVYEEMHTIIYNVSYEGESIPENIDRIPSAGNVFAVATIKADKVVPGSDPLDVSSPVLVIDGSEYAAVEDDDFLQHFGYTIFATSGSENVSCVASAIFEIPAALKDSDGLGWSVKVGGFASAGYTGKSTELPQEPSLEAHQAAVEAELLSQYAAKDDTSLENAIVMVNPYKISPLTALLMFDTDTPTTVKTTVKGQNGGIDIYTVDNDTTTHHVVPVYGLYADCDNTVEVIAGGESKTFTIHTDPIPEDLDKYVGDYTRTGASSLDENGFLFVLGRYRFAIDLEGKVRWYLAIESDPGSIEETMDDGSIWLSTTADGYGSELYRVSKLGKVLAHYSFNELNAHHDAEYIPESNKLLYFHFNEIRELDLTTGENTQWLDFASILDPTLGQVDNRNKDQSDWIHQNTLEISDGKVYMSYRNQAMLMKMDYATKQIEWVATPSSWVNPDGSKGALQPAVAQYMLVPTGENFQWFYSQHDISILPDQDGDPNTEDFTLFDNGCYRGDPNTKYKDMYSRVVQYRVDTVNGTIEQVYSFGDPVNNRIYSNVAGSTQFLDNGRYLGCFGSCDGNVKAYIVECSNDLDAMWEHTGYYVYRAYYMDTDEFVGEELNLGELAPVVQLDSFGWGEIETLPNTDAGLHYGLKERFVTENGLLTIEGWAVIEGYTNNVTYPYLVMTGQESGKHIAQMLQYNYNKTTIPAEYKEANTIYMNGFRSVGIDLSELPEDQYTVGMLVVSGNTSRYVDLGYTYTSGVAYRNVEVTDLLQIQSVIDAELAHIANSGTFTLSNPYIVVDPYGISPLSAYAIFSTSSPATISIEVKSKAGAADITNDFTDLTTNHVIPVYGLYSGEATDVTFTAHYANGSTDSYTAQITGGPLPAAMTHGVVSVAKTDKMAAGLTFAIASTDALRAFTQAIDANGDVRWISTLDDACNVCNFLKLSNGNILFGGPSHFGSYYKYDLIEVNFTGKIFRDYVLGSAHHDVVQKPDGNLLVCMNNLNGYNVEETIFEVDYNTGDVLRIWELGSYFNVNPDGVNVNDINYGGTDKDWFHNNAIDYCAEDDSIILSGRQQDAVIKINLSTGELVWILSDPDDVWPDDMKDKLLTPVGDNFEWQYGQHCAKWTANGDVMLFDNGDYRSKTVEGVVPAEDGYSRVVVYHIDEEAGTVEQVYQFGKELGNADLAAYISGEQELGANHFLMCFGGLILNGAGVNSYNIMDAYMGGSSGSDIFEVIGDEVVFKLSFAGPQCGGNFFRAYRSDIYLSSKEASLETGIRLGGMLNDGAASVSTLPSVPANLTAQNVSASDDGIHMTFSADVPGSSADLYLVGATTYKVPLAVASGTASVTLNDSDVPAGLYRLYLVSGGSMAELGLKWTNKANAISLPASYQVTVGVNDPAMGSAFGAGTYYANAKLVITAIAKEGYEFVNWTVGGTVVDTKAVVSFLPVGDVDLVANFKLIGEPDPVPPTPPAGGGGGGGGGAAASETASTDKNGVTTIKASTRADDGVATIEIAANTFADIIKEDKSNSVIVKPVISGDVESVVVKLPTSAVSSLSSKTDADLLITSELGTIAIPNRTLDEIVAKAKGRTIIFYIDEVSAKTAVSKLPADAQKDDVAAVEMTIVSNGEVVSTFGGKTLTVSFPVNAKVFADGQYPAYIVSDDKSVEKTTATVKDGLAYVTTSHFSTIILTNQQQIVNNFVDVNANAYYFNPVMWAVANGITTGTTATTFTPDQGCTRGQAVTFLWRAAGSPEPVTKVNPFVDVKTTDIFYKAVLWAYENNITQGTTATTFSPRTTCTRAQIMTYLYRFHGVNTLNLKVNPFVDVAAGTYYYDAVLWAADKKITSGTSATTFSPMNTCTRAQIVTFLYNYYNK